MEKTNKQILEKKIEAWKNKLIDLSRRNRLLNFKPTKVTTIKIIKTIPSDIFKSMVNDRKSFDFLSNDEDNEELFDESESKQYSVPGSQEDVPSTNEFEINNTNSKLQTNLPYDTLNKNLKRIHFRANQLMEEQGYNILYITLGILEWYDADQSEIKNRSPIIMLPVELRKRSIKSKYKIYPTDEDPFINPALQYKLNSEFSLNIPELNLEDGTFDLEKYFNKIKNKIDINAKWQIKNDIYMGLYSFAKFVMFKDLEKYNDIFQSNKIVNALAGIKDESLNTGNDFPRADELDEKRKPLDLYQVLDADSSQQEAIEAVKAKNSIVIQGPPGTGKSQTITNIIAELLARDKKILFVSEKMAALDVVYKRLQTTGLGDYCLEIHSRKSNKRHVLTQLKEAYQSNHPGKPVIDGKIDDLIKYRKELNEYSRTLHTPTGPLEKSAYWMIGELNQLSEIEILDLDLSKITNISYELYESIISTIRTLKDRIKIIGHPHKHPYWGCEINSINELQQQKLHKAFNIVEEKFKNVAQVIDNFSKVLSIELNDYSTTLKYCSLLEIFAEKHRVPESLINVSNIKNYINKIEPVLKNIDLYNSQRDKILEYFNENIYNEDVKKIVELLKIKYNSIWKVFKPSYYNTKKLANQHFTGAKKNPSHSDLIAHLEKIIVHQNLLIEINKTSPTLIEPLADLWKSKNTKTDVIRANNSWFSRYIANRVSSRDDISLKDWILDSNNISKELLSRKSQIQDLVLTMIKELNVLTKNLKVNTSIILKNGIEKTDFNRIDELLANWTSNIKLIVDWTRYQRAYADCKRGGLEPYLNIIYSGEDILFDIIKKFKKSFLFNQFQDILDKYPVLKTFESLSQDNIVKKFKELDSFQLELAKIRVLTNLFNRKPDASWEGSKSSQLGYLQRQFRLKRAHHPIRKIFGNVPSIVQQLCPCFMMSPLSLSQYINPEEMKFDYVIFDEASQMSPVDSLGAIIRGEYLVCVGDTKQLPPTTFFDRVAQVEYNDEESSIMDTQDLESILEECITIGMKAYLLNWHYRSKHESLIHFYNKIFYSNKLNTFPSAERDSSKMGLSLIQIENGIYDRGGSQRNIQEARTVAKAVFNHYKSNANKSLGVGTFGQSQQTAILDELEILRRNDSSLEYIFNDDREDPLFVKNLETIQGDERDVIFISVGYGRDTSGKITMNFGPLNKAGGERRLNVLITRAREKVVVFSSVTGNDFDLTKTQALGVHKLKQYLDFAQSDGDKSSIEPIDDLSGEFDETNIFEKSVYDQLLSMGIKVIPQVGYSGYKIDFGILHPKYPSKFILAVECDGVSRAKERNKRRI